MTSLQSIHQFGFTGLVCDACKVSKSVIAENSIYDQKYVSKYCYFVILTYKNYFIPYY